MFKKTVPIILALFIASAFFGLAKKPGLWAIYDTHIKPAKFVDLTHTFSETTPVWEGFGQAKFEPVLNRETGEPWSYEKGGFKATIYSHVGQYGTHCDPPCHFAKGGMTLDKIPVGQMILPLCIIDITDKLTEEPNHQCSVDDILEWEKEHGEIPEGAFVALRTDMYKDWTANPVRFARFPFPGWSMEAIQFLYSERHVTANGHEAMDTDTLDCAAEDWLLKQGHWQIEVMTNLDKVPKTGALIIVAWPKPKDGDGFPARAFAIYP